MHNQAVACNGFKIHHHQKREEIGHAFKDIHDAPRWACAFDYRNISPVQGRLKGVLVGCGADFVPATLIFHAKGKVIFARKTDQGGCVECHGISPGQTRFLDHKTWATPVLDVGTDSREYDILGWTVKTGVLEGAKIPFLTQPL